MLFRSMYPSHFSVGFDASCELLLFLYILDNQSQAVGLDSPQSQQSSNVTDTESQGKSDIFQTTTNRSSEYAPAW